MTERDGSKGRASAICMGPGAFGCGEFPDCLKKRLLTAYFGGKIRDFQRGLRKVAIMQGEEGS